MERKRPRKVNKKHLYILFNPDIKAFQGWEVVVEPWSLATCEKFLKCATLGKHFHLRAMKFIENTM
jgi:hypothetical protein